MQAGNDNRAGMPRRNAPKIGECGLRAEDIGFDKWLSYQFQNGKPSDVLKLVAVQAWEREQFENCGSISPINKTRFLAEIGFSNADLVNSLDRYGWIFLSHLGPRK